MQWRKTENIKNEFCEWIYNEVVQWVCTYSTEQSIKDPNEVINIRLYRNDNIFIVQHNLQQIWNCAMLCVWV